MYKQKNNFIFNKKELEKAILQEKAKGIPDIEIGQRFGVTYRYIEKIITQAEGINISSLKSVKKIKYLHPKDFKEEKTTIWSFKKRGDWATHSGEYRGNYSPNIPRNVILKYSNPGDLVLDYFCGAGTTAVEAKLLGRRCISLDINDHAIELAMKNINFDNNNQSSLFSEEEKIKIFEPELKVGDARDLSFLESNSVDLICSHPPYANIIHYTNSKEGDLSFLDIDEFLQEMSKVAKESFRVLKPKRKCAILIGDTRRKKSVIPLGFRLMDVFLDAGFELRELIIKRQHNCKTTGFWYENSIKYNFLLLAHEYLPVFEKPEPKQKYIKESKRYYEKMYSFYKKPKFRKKEETLETTTVWIFPNKDFEEHLNKNIIERYSKNKDYFLLIFDSSNQSISTGPLKKDLNLLFIKSHFLEKTSSSANLNLFFENLKEIARSTIHMIRKGAHFIVQCQDVRVNGDIDPIAKRVVNSIPSNQLLLKEIIVVTKNNDEVSFPAIIDNNYLRINHQYLIIYEKVI